MNKTLIKELEALKKRVEALEIELALLDNPTPPITDYESQLIWDTICIVKLYVDEESDGYPDLLDNMPTAYSFDKDGEIIFSFYLNSEEDFDFIRSKLPPFMEELAAKSFLTDLHLPQSPNDFS